MVFLHSAASLAAGCKSWNRTLKAAGLVGALQRIVHCKIAGPGRLWEPICGNVGLGGSSRVRITGVLDGEKQADSVLGEIAASEENALAIKQNLATAMFHLSGKKSSRILSKTPCVNGLGTNDAIHGTPSALCRSAAATDVVSMHTKMPAFCSGSSFS